MHFLPKGLLKKLRENVREFGLQVTAERSSVWIAEHLLGSTLHRHARAPLSAFAETAASMHFSGDDLAGTYLFLENSELGLSQVRSEYDVLCDEVAARYGKIPQGYPQNYALERGSAFLLYALVRSLRPSTVVETGVANGHSSFFVLSALRANGHGLLHSVDRSPAVGLLLSGEERERWRLHVLKGKGLKRSLLEILDNLPSIDFFLHDSDHTYPWQSFELRAALKKLSPGAVLASDDCDCCYAFLDLCRQANFRPVILVETRKVFGLVFLEKKTERRLGPRRGAALCGASS